MSAAVQKLLGEAVTNAAGETVPVSSLAGAKVLGLYFSAHWCGPCRAFTPQLAEAYAGLKERLGFEVVFVSSDRDDESFREYLAEMPWLAVPFEQQALRAKLSVRYKVQGIPTLVVVDAASGKLITTDGREHLAEDPEGARFPWAPPPIMDLIPARLDGGEGRPESVDTAEALAGDDTVLGIYFSAHWCGPCRSFTPVLAATYKRLRQQGKRLEIVFVSSDRDEAQYKLYLADQPWLGVPFADAERKQALKKRFHVQGIPTLVFVDPRTGRVINAEGRAAVSLDPAGADYPWHPKAVNELTGATARALSDRASLVVFLGSGATDELLGSVRAALNETAEARALERKAAGDDDEDDTVSYFFAGDDPVVQRVRQVMGDAGGAAVAVVHLLDRAVYALDSVERPQDVTAAGLRQFLADFDAGRLEGAPLVV